MSEAALRRIEKALTKLAKQQTEICERIGGLEERASARGDSGSSGVSQKDVLAYLDGFRAGEALGEESLAEWVSVCTTDCLRGGLRTVAEREGMHARLLEQRIRELGGTPRAETPKEVREAVMKQSGSTEKTDAQKLAEFVSRFQDIDAALKPIHDFADRLDDDQETQSMLRTIAQDERATLEFLNEACALLNP